MINKSKKQLLDAIKKLSAHSPQGDSAGATRLPLKVLKLNPSDAFRLRVLKLSAETGQSPAVIAEQLLEIAAGMDVRPIRVCPQNGPEAGVALEDVVRALHKTLACIRTLESTEDAPVDKVETLREAYVQCIEMSIAVDKLAGETFYNHATLSTMQAFAFKNSEALTKLAGEIAALEKPSVTESSDAQKQKAEKLASMNVSLEARKELATVLVRLGFAPEFSA